MSLSSTVLMKRPLLDENDFSFPAENLYSYPKEKRSKIFESTFDGYKDLNGSYSSHELVMEGSDSLFPTDFDLISCNHDLLYDIPQNLFLSLLDDDPSTSHLYFEQSIALPCTSSCVETSLTSQTAYCDVPSIQSSSDVSNDFYQMPAPARDFTTAGPGYAQSFKRIPPPPYPSFEVPREIDQKFETPPRRPTSLRLATSLPLFGASTPMETNLSENQNNQNVHSVIQCNGGFRSQQQPYGRLPVMQSFLELKKSPLSPANAPSHPVLPEISSNSLSLNSLPQSLQTINSPANASYPSDYSNGITNIAELCHQSLLQAYSENIPSTMTDPKIALSPDSTYSPSAPGVVLMEPLPILHASNCSGDKLNMSGGYRHAPSSNNYLYEMQASQVQFNHLGNVETSFQNSSQLCTEVKTDENIATNSVNKECPTMDAKTPKYILHALMEKIKRNQSAKNQLNNEDIKPIVDEKHLDIYQIKNENLRIWDSLRNEMKIPKDVESLPEESSQYLPSLKRGRANSYSNYKVTVGEADTSQENLHHERKGHQKMDRHHADNSGPVTPEDLMPTNFRNSNYLDSFLFHLNAPISSIRKTDKDPRITYLNKGQYYVLSMDCISEKLKSSQAVFKTVVMVLFQDPGMVGNELGAWKVWHNKQQSFKQRILDVDFKNASSGSPQGIEEIAYNATAVAWEGFGPGIKVNVAVNCLSTDFSNQKGVKGIPLLIQLDTYLEEELIHRAHCNIKVFCDKGAERKVRDEERKNKEHKISSDEHLNLPTSSTSPQLPVCNFHTSNDFSKIPLLFNPKPNVHIKTTSSRTYETLFKARLNVDLQALHSHGPETSDHDANHSSADKIILFVKEEQEKAFNALVLDSPTVQGLIEAISSKYNLKKDGINNLYKKSKRGILVKIDDQVIRHYGNESTYIIHSTHSTSSDAYDVTLQEI